MDKLDLILQELAAIKNDVTSVKSEVASVKSEVAKLNVTIENEIKPQIKLLAEGQEALLVKLAPRTEVEKLREELEFLRDIVKLHSREINELKKAQ